MNKLDAISRRSGRMRVMVRLIKGSITGVCACVLIASSTQLNMGSLTYALDDAELAHRLSAGSIKPTQAVYTAASEAASPLDEDALIALFPDSGNDSTDENPPIVYERPGALRPEGYEGNAVTFDENGNVSVYGIPVTEMTAKTQSGIPAESEAVNDDYFRESVFVGNSLIVGMQKAAALDTTYYANIGLSVRQFFEKAFLPSPDGETTKNGSPLFVTAAEALARNNSFKRVYLMFGINELGWASIDAFVSQYETLIDTILTIRPDAVIYVQAILPINEAVLASTENPPSYCTNERITAFNLAIASMTARKNIVFLTPGEVLVDENGSLDAAATTDGIHLNSTYIRRWKQYLTTHTTADVDLSVFAQNPDDEESIAEASEAAAADTDAADAGI